MKRAKLVFPFIATVVALTLGKIANVTNIYPLWVVAVLVMPTVVAVMLVNMDFLNRLRDKESWWSLILAVLALIFPDKGTFRVTVKDWPTLLSTVVVWAVLTAVVTIIPPSTLTKILEASVEWLMAVSWVAMIMCIGLVFARHKLKWNSSFLLVAFKRRLHLPPVTLLALAISLCVTALLQEAGALRALV